MYVATHETSSQIIWDTMLHLSPPFCVIFDMEMLADVIATSCLTDKRICVQKASCFTSWKQG